MGEKANIFAAKNLVCDLGTIYIWEKGLLSVLTINQNVKMNAGSHEYKDKLLGQNMRNAAVILGNRVKAVTLRDSDGTGDTAILPFTAVSGSRPRTDWLNIIRGLREISFDGLIIMNFAGTASITSPMLKPALIKYARDIGDFFAWQVDMENMLKRYESRVLFGAGNMCRAYMRCYGEKYPPLSIIKQSGERSFAGLM